MNIGVIGAGSIGLLVSYYLGREHQVHVYVNREEQKDGLSRNGITCLPKEDQTPVQAHLKNEGYRNHDVLIVTVKQSHLDEVLATNLLDGTPVLFLQNGMGHVEKVQTACDVPWVGVVEHGALKIGDTEVHHTGKGKIAIASIAPDGKIAETAASLNTNDFPIEFHEDYYDMLSSKLVVNTVINPLTALFGLKNGCILTNPYINELAEKLCEEACSVLERSFSYEWNRLQKIADNTKANQSSMLKDIIEGRRTEIDAISGYIIEKGGHPVPYHRFIVKAIHALEAENRRDL
ncbi:2-dehydropantoate 2-reductase [Halobacillus yeomjeoni]|uniref:2-dehydropantoate 2-reductase n=1 Tax=Halobacillus yeomjeoni TaxID=311194 RepID=UPI001CD36E4D|nr:2-dehydropantoate 2-reductase [Halobacillus yeomjeoni]MCA0983580.1 2-dehydropantoate 2-reductase [Halobacillus yeomjeoni]